MPFHIPEEETLDRAALGCMQRDKLARMWPGVLEHNRFYRRRFRDSSAPGFDPQADELSHLPLTTRAELQQDQLDHPPYGTNLTFPIDHYTRLHQTSGSKGTPLRWLDTPDAWAWWKRCWGIIYRAAGITHEDRLIFPFSFGPFIGFWGAFESAVALGHLSLPAGGMTTLARLQYMLENDVTFVCCTPTYALRMAEVAAEAGIDLPGSKVHGLIVAGESGGHIPATRERIESAWGARVFDHAGMTEIGPWGFECLEWPDGMHIMETDFIAEVIDPDTGQPAGEGEIGELVLTNLGRIGSPLIRYRTGDQVRMIHGRCACGRWFARVEGGILGRRDDMMVIRGNNVFPSALEGIVRRFPEVAEFHLELDERRALPELRIVIEPTAHAPDDLADRITHAVRDRLHFKPVVTLAEPGALPRFEMKAKRFTRTSPSGGRADSSGSKGST